MAKYGYGAVEKGSTKMAKLGMKTWPKFKKAW